MVNKYCILLTASIDPGNTPKVGRNDILQREQDYIKALKFYIKSGIPVIFCENSGYKSEEIEQLISSSDKVEYLKFKSEFSYLGKSHGEKEIFDYVYANSSYLKESEYVIKITGRLIVKNLLKIIYKINDSKIDLFVNLVRNISCTDSRFFIFQKLFYPVYFEPSLSKYLNEPIGDGFEICLARAYHQAMAEGKKCILLPEFPIYIGVNAWNNKQLDRGVYVKLKYKIYYYIKLYVFRQTI